MGAPIKDKDDECTVPLKGSFDSETDTSTAIAVEQEKELRWSELESARYNSNQRNPCSSSLLRICLLHVFFFILYLVSGVLMLRHFASIGCEPRNSEMHADSMYCKNQPKNFIYEMPETD